MQQDIGGDYELVAAMISGSVHKQQDKLPGIFLGQCVQKNLEALRIRRRQNQIDAGSVLGADCAIEVDVFTNELRGDLRPDADGSPARPRLVDPTEARLVGKHDPQATAAPGGSSLGFPHRVGKTGFLKAFWAARSRLG